MVKEPTLSLTDQFKMLRDIGFDGVELDAPGIDIPAVLAAISASGLPVNGTIDRHHWSIRLSDPRSETRATALNHLLDAIRQTHAIGASSVLLVPGKVTDPLHENQQQVWDRSIEAIRLALPLAAELGVFIAIENVWNGFNYLHDGPPDQSADAFVRYIDTIDSPLVAMHFDIGNHQKYGRPDVWIRQLGSRRIVRLDVKDWGGPKRAFTPIGQGDVDWPAVRQALADIRFTGWAAAEVTPGNRDALALVSRQMDKYLLGIDP
jgi:hexulose-6-phosphate isomerase